MNDRLSVITLTLVDQRRWLRLGRAPTIPANAVRTKVVKYPTGNAVLDEVLSEYI